MRLPRAKITVEWIDITNRHVTAFVAMAAVAFVLCKGVVSGIVRLRFRVAILGSGSDPDPRCPGNMCHSLERL